MIELEHPGEDVAAAFGLPQRGRKRGRGGKTCADCYFHRHFLCALELDEPCSTFRPDAAEGLAPPRQPALLPRQADQVEARAA